MHIENSSYVEVSGLTFRNGIGDENGKQTLMDRVWHSGRSPEFIQGFSWKAPAEFLFWATPLPWMKRVSPTDLKLKTDMYGACSMWRTAGTVKSGIIRTEKCIRVNAI